jgi:hypothetical protein
MIEDNIDDLVNQILSETQYLDKGIDGELSNLVLDIQRELYNGEYTSRTGNLRRSIKVKFIDQGDSQFVVVEMLDYGFFISFGVNGKKRKLGIPINEAVAGGNFKLRYQPGHIFGSKSNPVIVPGIRPRKFYPLDIQERIIKILTKNDNV